MKKQFLLVAAVITSSYLQAQQASATQQDSIKSLNDIVVTAARFPIKQSQTGKVVTVIDQQTLQNSGGKTINELLNYQAGIFISGANNTLGTNQDVFMRGASSGNTLILLDGIPVNDPSLINNSFDLNNININQIEKIEILKGAQSTLWGSDAVAGVINIITKKGGSKAFSPSANFSYGSYNTYKAGAGINGKLDKLTYNINYNYTHSTGFSSAYDSTGTAGFDKDGFNQNNLQANIGYTFNPSFSIAATSNYGKYNNALDAGAFKDDKDYKGANTSFINSLALNYTFKTGAVHFTNTLVHTSRVLQNDTTSEAANGDYFSAVYKGNSFVSELFGNFKLGKLLSLVSGVQHIAQNSDQHSEGYSRDYQFGYSSALGKDSTKTSNYSAYASVLLLNANGFNAEAGMRYNHHSIYGNNQTFSFNPSYNIDENTKVFVNISSAFKVPSLYQLYSEYGNKQLKPEKSSNYEFGLQTFNDNKNNSLRIVGFKRDGRDVIIFADLAVAPYGRYLNNDKQNDYGFEVESITAVGKLGRWQNNFTYADGQAQFNGQKTNNLYRRPNFTFNSTLTLQPVKGLAVIPSFQFIGSRLKGLYDAGPAEMPKYYTINFYAGYHFTKKVMAFADFKNITNQQYFEVAGYNSRRFNYMAGVSVLF